MTDWLEQKLVFHCLSTVIEYENCIIGMLISDGSIEVNKCQLEMVATLRQNGKMPL